MIRFLVGAGLALLALVAAYILEGGLVWTLFGFSAFLITFFVPFFGALAVWSFRTWTQAWSHAFRPGTGAEAKVSVDIWRFSEFTCYLAGGLGWLVGGILILGGSDWNDMARVGRAFAASLIAPLYAGTFGFVCRILRARVEALMAK
jgi:hypothetical protein